MGYVILAGIIGVGGIIAIALISNTILKLYEYFKK